MIKIRTAEFDDVIPMKELHDRAVMVLCRNDYTVDELQDWNDLSPLEKYYWRLERQRIFLAEREGRMIGFVRWYPETNELCSICVEPEFARQGLGSLLMERVFQDAREFGVHGLWLDASLTAVPFYQQLGWVYQTLSKDGPLDSVRMTIQLSP